MTRAVSLLCIVLAAGMGSAPVSGQESLHERWTFGFLADGWAPRWHAMGLFEGLTTASPRVAVELEASAVGLRSSWGQRKTAATVLLRRSLGRGVVLGASAATTAWSAETTNGRTLIETPRSEAVSAGVEVAESFGRLGRVGLTALVGWDGGSGGEGRLSMRNERYSLLIRRWRVRSRDSRIFFPADSLRDLGLSQLASGTEASASTSVSIAGIGLRPVALWRREQLDDHEAPGDAFFQTSPTGNTTLYQLGLGLSAGPWILAGSFRSRVLDIDSRFFHVDVSAGRLFIGRLDLTAWEGSIGRNSNDVQWAVALRRELSEGELSSRVETWPFTSIWGQLSSQAYRLRALLTTESWTARIQRRSTRAAGWSWGAEVGRYRLRVDRESWFVTSFGFGRDGVENVTAGADPAYLLGGDVGRTFPMGASSVDVRVAAGIPVHASDLGDTGTATEGGLAGYGSVSLVWWW